MKKRIRRKGKRSCRMWLPAMCVALFTAAAGLTWFHSMRVDAASEQALSNQSWEKIKPIIEKKIGTGYHEAGMCTGYLYWCLKNAYGVDWGDNSYVVDLENKLIEAGITKVAEGTTGEITGDMKPGDIIIFINGTSRSHCAILGEGGKLYHARTSVGVVCGPTLAEWMEWSKEPKTCDEYVVYRGLDSLKGSLSITKSSDNEDMTQNNACYSLKDVQYGLYKGSKLIGKLTTNAKGKASLEDIPYGSYTLKEIAAGTGYALDLDTYNIKVDSEVTTKKVRNTPQSAMVDAVLYKLDKESQEKWTKDNRPQGGASLAGAEYAVKYYDGYYTENTDFSSLKPTRSWVLKTDETGRLCMTKEAFVSGDAFYESSSGQAVLPLGTVTMQETKAPEGYVLDSTLHVRQITSEGKKENVDTYHIPVHSEQIMRGDLEFLKVKGDSQERLANIPFTLTSKSTGEKHTIVTDPNGFASTSASWNLHTQDTNGGRYTSGIWFGAQDAVDDAVGALPYDTYILDEQSCEGNLGLTLIQGVEIVIYKDEITIDLGTLTDEMIQIETSAAEKETGMKEADASGEITLVDTVAYDGLTPGQEYTLAGTVYSKATGEPLMVHEAAVENTKVFVPGQKKGTIDIEFTFDAGELGGTDVVVFERLYTGKTLTAIHEDIHNTAQTVHIRSEEPELPPPVTVTEEPAEPVEPEPEPEPVPIETEPISEQETEPEPEPVNEDAVEELPEIIESEPKEEVVAEEVDTADRFSWSMAAAVILLLLAAAGICIALMGRKKRLVQSDSQKEKNKVQ